MFTNSSGRMTSIYYSGSRLLLNALKKLRWRVFAVSKARKVVTRNMVRRKYAKVTVGRVSVWRPFASATRSLDRPMTKMWRVFALNAVYVLCSFRFECIINAA